MGLLVFLKDLHITEQINNGYFTNVAAGSYTLTVTDDNGCFKKIDKTNITNPDSVSIDDVSSTQVLTCYGDNSGSITISASGGTNSLHYSIDSAQTWQTDSAFNNLYAGDYNIFVKDSNSCQASGGVVNITQPTELLIDSVEKTDITQCYGDNTGQIIIYDNGGGTGTKYYSIENSPSWQNNGGNFSNLFAGTYYIKIKDSNGCTVIGDTITLTEPTELTVTIDSTHNVNCNGDNNGAVYTTTSGGTAPYTYSWTNTSQTTEDITNLTANTYAVTVTDAHGCTATNNTTITEPPLALTIAID